MSITKEMALNYHTEGRPGKIEVIPTKPTSTQLDLGLAYTPGVAVPVLEREFGGSGFQWFCDFGVGKSRPNGFKTGYGRERGTVQTLC